MRIVLLLGLVVSGLLIALSMNATRAETPDGVRAEPEVLELLLKETPKPNYGVPVPKRINGHVMLCSDGSASGVKGVSITDGYSVVKTDELGVYTLTPHASAVFIYITRPSGHEVQGQWYKPLAAKVDFALKPGAQDENEYIFVHVTDTHVSTDLRSVAGLSRFVREVNALTPKPRFVVNSGDLLNLHKALVTSPAAGRADFRNYVGIMNHLTMPYYNVAGDHTDSSYRLKEFPRGDHRCGKPLYWEYLGPNFFSFEYGKIHFVSVDFGYHLGQRQVKVNGKMLEYPTNEVQPMHVEWLKQDMSHRTRDTFVVTTSEADLENHCREFEDMARQHDIRLQLVGDNHVVAHKTRTVPYRSGGALAGCWWNPKAEQLCPDLSPQGYLIYRVQGEQLEHFYKGLGQRVAIVSHRVGALLKGSVQIQAHLVQPKPDESLEYSMNGNDWLPMREIGRPFYRTLYQATVDTTSLADGLSTFRVKNTDGEVRTRQFVVANGHDTSSFETDALLRFDVGTKTGWTTARAPSGKADVLLNGKFIGALEPDGRKKYSFKIPATHLRNANVLSFHFTDKGDGMTLGSPVLTVGDRDVRDPRDVALRRVKTAHWGSNAADWGGYIVGDAAPPDESPFHRRQNVFCFVLNATQ